ncbi:MAG: hypothetical protein WCQ99_04885 [Pseudomonadota bacterium]
MKAPKIIIICMALAMFFLHSAAAWAADFHVTDAQGLQTALSTAAANGQDDIIYLAAGTYSGNFSCVGTESQSLTMKLDSGVNPGQVVKVVVYIYTIVAALFYQIILFQTTLS